MSHASRHLGQILPAPVVFLLSIPVALVQPNLAKWLWLVIFAVGFVLQRIETDRLDDRRDGQPALLRSRGG